MSDNNSNDEQEYLSVLDELLGNAYVPFNIKASHDYTEVELLAELQAKGIPLLDVGWVEMLESGSSWHITVRRSGVESFQEKCPWQITSGAGEAEGLKAPGNS